jgi:hypothetical protein
MKKGSKLISSLAFVAATIMLFAAPLAQAAWVRVFQNIHGTTYYMDPTTVEHHGSMRRVWEMQSFREASKEGLRSMRLYKEYDCKEEIGRFKQYFAHTGPEATGEIMGNVTTPSEWKTVNSNPAGKGVFRVVCEDYNKPAKKPGK